MAKEILMAVAECQSGLRLFHILIFYVLCVHVASRFLVCSACVFLPLVVNSVLHFLMPCIKTRSLNLQGVILDLNKVMLNKTPKEAKHT